MYAEKDIPRVPTVTGYGDGYGSGFRLQASGMGLFYTRVYGYMVGAYSRSRSRNFILGINKSTKTD